MQQILTFLTELAQHNDKVWMDAHREDYYQARDQFTTVVESLIQGMAPLDNLVASLVPKDCMFRINRDIRFSKNKAPYKTNMGAYLAPGGKKGGYAGYYLHLEPKDKSFVAGGIYHPAPKVLQQIRQEIDYNAKELIPVLSAPQFVSLFGPLQGEKLTKAPKGYPNDHPQVELLKLKSLLAIHPITDSFVLQGDFVSQVVNLFSALVPLNKFLNAALHE
ncbi:MAG: DUF2461 domain-containing protein [Bacteroidota bacterium]